MPSETPAEWISCNACLICRGYIRIVHCDPRVEGWPYDDRQCDLCDQGWDCETWLRVKGVGEGVEKALRRLDPEAYHPVTWADAGLVPFKDGTDPQFESKAALDDYFTELVKKHPLWRMTEDVYKPKFDPNTGSLLGYGARVSLDVSRQWCSEHRLWDDCFEQG